MTPAYSPERPRAEGNVVRIETEFGTRVRFMVISLAKREAREAVKRRLRAEGKVKASLLSASELSSPYVFLIEAGTPTTTAWFLRMVQRTGQAAKLPFPVHPHMLRHSTGFRLANDGHDTRSLAHYLGHRNLQSTARYTALAPDRFARFWQDSAVSPLALAPGGALPCYVRIKSTSCPVIGAFSFSSLDAGCFFAAGNCKTVACWPSCRNVSRTSWPSGNSRAS